MGDKAFEVLTSPQDFRSREEGPERREIDLLAELNFIPRIRLVLEEKKRRSITLKLMEILDEHDDVQKVHANSDISDEVMEKVAAATA